MQFAILIYEPESDVALRDDPAKAPEYWAGWTAYGQAIAAAGIMRGGEGLQPYFSGTTLRVRGGERHVQDGPYAETKEHLGGFFVIDVKDLDEALEWAARCPAAPTGSVEVRPTLTMS